MRPVLTAKKSRHSGAMLLKKEGTMFSGIIQAVGNVVALQPRGGDVRLVIDVGDLDAASIALGDSIAVSGVCLTVVEIVGSQLTFDVSNETLSRTALGTLGQSSTVNLEKALRL